tara:strand:+ start:25 stop:699 length:675 start_codon:yes stop_codon:yes gene_type:complete
MAAGGWFDWSTGDLVTEARFQDIQDSIVFIFASEAAANSALTNKVTGTIFYDTGASLLKAWNGSSWIGAEAGDIEGVTAGTNLNGGGTSGTVTVNLDTTIDSIALKDYSEVDVAVTSSSGVVAIDMNNGNTGSITLTENITDIDFTNVPTNGVATFTLQITQHASSAKTVAINAVTVNGGGNVTAKTAGGSGFTVSTGANAIDLVTFLFLDAGTPLLNALQDFS